MRWIHPLSGEASPELIGGKAHGLCVLRRLGLGVPPGFVIGTAAGRAFHRYGRLPDGLGDELAAAVAELETATGRGLGGPERPLVVSVRSGASVSMPGMMATILNLGLTAAATDGLARETGDPAFAHDTRRRFLAGLAAASAKPGTVDEDSDDAHRQLELAVAAVFASWDAPRARAYRELHDIPHDLGTAVVVQAMVFGNRDEHSAAGVAFSRDPTTGEPVPFGEVLFGHQGDDVVSGRSLTRPLGDLSDREPEAGAALANALNRLEAHYRDASYVEFTVESGRLWLLQARPGRFAGPAAVRVAIDLVDEGLIGRHEALLRVSPGHLGPAVRRIDTANHLARGTGASSGVAVGRVATSSAAAVRMAAHGPVILVRPETSPVDLPGLAAAVGVLTARGGPASHAAIVARSMGRPAVVGVIGLTVENGRMYIGERSIEDGTLVTIDGTGGEVALGTVATVSVANDERRERLLAWADEVADPGEQRSDPDRLRAAQDVLRNASEDGFERP
jgi:pyruvate,orthophosphate dikinase